jgi:hypothetical protein
MSQNISITEKLMYVYMACIAIGSLYMVSLIENDNPNMLRCDIAEISPDFTTEQRQICREKRRIKLEREKSQGTTQADKTCTQESKRTCV